MNNIKSKESIVKSEQSSNRCFSALRKSFGILFPHFRRNCTYISAGVTLQGDLIAKERVVIDGNVYGNIRTSEHLTLGDTSHLEGNIDSESIMVSGYVKGRIQANTLLTVRVPATIIGDLVAASVQIESGVILHGKITANPNQNPQLHEMIPNTPIVALTISEESAEAR